MKVFEIKPINEALAKDLQEKTDLKTKPVGSLGQLETIAKRIGLIQNTLSPALNQPHIIVFAGDHGITEEGVSPYPQEVTYQMVFNFLQGGAAINVFSKQNNIALKVVDAGVNFDFEEGANLINAKIGYGTKNFANQPAMTSEECSQALNKGAEIVTEIQEQGCNIVGFGEMGIGNTSAAAALMAVYTGIPIEDCVGAGTGLDSEGVQHKISVLKKALEKNTVTEDAIEKLAIFGGFEIAMITGAMLKAAVLKMTIMVDGFIVTSALLAASKINKEVLDYCIFTHTSHEKGHQKMLAHLNADPILDLNMRLGEGTGGAVAYPIIQSAVTFLNEMASFESAGVSNKEGVEA